MVRRAREADPPALHDRVLTALPVLGTGFVAAPGNGALRERLEAGELAATDLHHQLLTLVHRLLFLFAAEDRGVTLDPSGTVARLRRDAPSGRRGAGPPWRRRRGRRGAS